MRLMIDTNVLYFFYPKAVSEDVTIRRMEKQLFAGRTITVVEAAAYIDYSNASYFAQDFRKKFGVNPS